MVSPQERIGQSIGDYRLLRILGNGTFGTVYLAEHLHDHTQAAIKVFHFPLKNSDDFRAFLKEARTVRLRHPHIVPILDFDLSRDDLPYLVMTYADGGSLRDRYPKGSKLSHKTIDIYVQQLASALQYAHDHRIIHRDVKPENMLLCSDSTVQLSNFGIAKISELASLSSQHKAVGTPAYTAPEQSLGKACSASDQYALAIVVYEWLAGQRPFQGDPLALALQHRIDAPPSLHSICPEVSLQDAICRNACQPLGSFQTGTRLYSSPTVANCVVYVGTTDNKLYAFDATCHHDCQPLWFFLFPIGASITSSPTVANGIIYIGTKDGKLYAFGLPTSSRGSIAVF